MFPEDFIEEVRSANGVFEVISEYVPLKKSGHSFRGLCPFHSEKTPSFFVNPDRQIFHCFGCGAGGNAFTFLMQYENISFPEAVRHLASRSGIPLPAIDKKADRAESAWRIILSVNEKAEEYFKRKLIDSREGKLALKYLAGRGIDEGRAKNSSIGWSPRGWEHLRNYLRKNGFSDDVMVKAGLVIPRKGGDGFYDRFRGRLMFPIANVQGQIVAFGGRVLGKDEEPKYINSPESPLYQKGKILYGLNLAKAKIRENGYAVVVEGYFDVITARLHGAGNAVATMGTALTRGQLRLLRRYTRKVVVIYDSDAAGIEATKRSLELFLDEGMTVNSASLPEGHDPDSLIRANGVDAFRSALKNSTPLMDFFIEKTALKWQKKGIEGKAHAVEEILPVMSRIKNNIIRSEYARKVAKILDIREEAFIAELMAYMTKRKDKVVSAKDAVKTTMRKCAEEEELIRAMLLNTALARRIKAEVSLSHYSDETCRAVASAVYEALDRGIKENAPLNPNLENKEAAALAARLMSEDGKSDNLGKVVSDCLVKLRKTRLMKELKEVQEKIRRAEVAKQPEILDELLKIKQNIAKA